MRIYYANLSFPSDSKGYRSVTETTADVTVCIEGRDFVRLQEILVLEMAFVVQQWLKKSYNGEIVDFDYSSMDEEETPLLAFSSACDGTYRAVSCWSDIDVQPVSEDQIQRAFSEFFQTLTAELRVRFGFEIEKAMSICG